MESVAKRLLWLAVDRRPVDGSAGTFREDFSALPEDSRGIPFTLVS